MPGKQIFQLSNRNALVKQFSIKEMKTNEEANNQQQQQTATVTLPDELSST